MALTRERGGNVGLRAGEEKYSNKRQPQLSSDTAATSRSEDTESLPCGVAPITYKITV